MLFKSYLMDAGQLLNPCFMLSQTEADAKGSLEEDVDLGRMGPSCKVC